MLQILSALLHQDVTGTATKIAPKGSHSGTWLTNKQLVQEDYFVFDSVYRSFTSYIWSNINIEKNHRVLVSSIAFGFVYSLEKTLDTDVLLAPGRNCFSEDVQNAP